MTLYDLLDPIYDPTDPDLHPFALAGDDVRDLDVLPYAAPVGSGLLREEQEAGR